MPRVPYRTDDDAGPADIVEQIRKRRGGTLIELDRALLQAPPYARGWSELLGAVRTELGLAAKLRELAICGVAVLNGADYEFSQHAPLFIAAGGTAAQLDALRAIDTAVISNLFDRSEQAALRLTIEMTRRIRVEETTFATVLAILGSNERAVELVGVIATYNMVSRFLVALEIEPEEGPAR